ncbi:glycosyltransferase family 39 protein [Cytophagaceae bacterium ABcell3]|nr:glycosyltransferase family 39 protein [Cytophagaceae bacterium ABcell3]
MQNRIVVFFIFSLYLALHLYTLNLNPLPWFDETFFASISLSLAETGKLVPGVTKTIQEGREMLIHGPVYYFLGGLSFEFFGLGIFQFRIINFLFGIGLVFITARIFRNRYKDADVSLPVFLIATFLLDPFFNLSLHEGRMDLVAAFFVFTCIYLLLKGLENKQIMYFLASGLYGAMGLLTTPRVAFIFAAVFIVFLVLTFKRGGVKGLLQILLWGLPFVILYGMWVWYAFGDFGGLISYYQSIATGKHTVDVTFIGGNLYIPRHEYLLIGVAGISLIYGLIREGFKFFDALICISILSVVLFYLLVRDMGPYSALILPFYYIIIFKSFHLSGHLTLKNPVVYLMVVLFAFNAGFFLIKNIQVLFERLERNPEIAYSFIEDHIPEGSKVVGDPLYYYAVKRSGSDYQYADLFGTLEEREQALTEEWGYEYFIVTEQLRMRRPEVIRHFFEQEDFVEVARLISRQNPISRAISRLGITSDMEKDGYSAIIYRRKVAETP